MITIFNEAPRGNSSLGRSRDPADHSAITIGGGGSAINVGQFTMNPVDFNAGADAHCHFDALSFRRYQYTVKSPMETSSSCARCVQLDAIGEVMVAGRASGGPDSAGAKRDGSAD
ncbi:MAG TPA: hypothetical protein VGO30_21530 [Mycobacterium sp.]|nr:hypothetical protein [Mycobacterium sp.]